MTGNQRSAPRTIVALGEGLVARAAAVALRRALPGCEVILAAQLGALPLAEEASLILPAAIEALGRLGLDEDQLVRAGCASHRLCERFEGWGPKVFAVDPAERPRIGGAALYQLWLAHGEGSFDALSPAVALAQAQRFAPTDVVEPALAIDRDGFATLLDGLARHLGVIRSRPVEVREDEAGNVTVRLPDGRVVVPDLLVDAAHAAEPKDRETVVAYERPRMGAPLLFDAYLRDESGWRALWCGPRANLELFVPVAGAAPPEQDGGWRRIAYSRRLVASPRAGNRVVLTIAPGPFLRMDLSISLQLLGLLLDLLPSSAPEPLLAAEYNRRAAEIVDDAVDFAGAFTPANATRRVETVIEAFSQIGRLPAGIGELVGSSAWMSLMIGLGVRPLRPDPLAASAPAQAARSALGALQAQGAELAGRMPPYPQWLRSVASA